MTEIVEDTSYEFDCEWGYYYERIDIPDMRRLCEIANNLQEKRNRVLRGIKRRFIYGKDFMEMDMEFGKLLTGIMAVIRKVHEYITGGKSEWASKEWKEFDSLKDDVQNILKFSEHEKNNLNEELSKMPVNCPNILMYITRINKVLGDLNGVMNNLLNYKRTLLLYEFLLSYYNKRGITVSPDFLKAIKEAKEEEI